MQNHISITKTISVQWCNRGNLNKSGRLLCINFVYALPITLLRCSFSRVYNIQIRSSHHCIHKHWSNIEICHILKVKLCSGRIGSFLLKFRKSVQIVLWKTVNESQLIILTDRPQALQPAGLYFSRCSVDNLNTTHMLRATCSPVDS